MSKLWQLSAADIAKMVSNNEISAEEVANSHLDRIDEVNPVLNALTIVERGAPAKAKAFDQGNRSGKLPGVTFTSKINVDHAGYPTDDGVAFLAGDVATETTSTVLGLEEAGATMVGRSNAPALAFRIHTGNELHGETFNPFDKAITPGGSSGGAGVAVATGMCAVAQGNDIGGSIRWPAFCNGIYGLRPSMGRMNVMRANTAAPRFASSMTMSTNGPLARTVEDLWLAFEAMSQRDSDDPRKTPVSLTGMQKPTSKKVALVTSDGHAMSTETKRALQTAGKHLEDAGYEVEEINPPMLENTFSLWMRIAAPELIHQTDLMMQIPDEDFVTWTRDVIETFPTLEPDTYFRAIVERDLIGRAWMKFMNDYPIMVMMNASNNSMPARYDTQGLDAVKDVFETLRYQFSLPALGFPVLQAPINVGIPKPNGVQILGSPFREDLLFDAAREIEIREGKRSVVEVAW
jgi:amidase